MSLYVGIDASYTGFAVTFFDGSTHETIRKAFPPGKYGIGAERLFHIDEWLYEEFTLRHPVLDIKHVCLEGYAYASQNGREQAGELGGIVKICLLQSLPFPACLPTIVPPTKLKKFVVGSGTASKNEILLHVYKKWGVEFSDDNDADSYALARLAYSLDTEETTHAYERHIINELTRHTEMRTETRSALLSIQDNKTD